MYNDSQGADALAKNLVYHSTSKHIEVWYHFFRDCVTRKKLILKKIPVVDNILDAMAKSIMTDRFHTLWIQMANFKAVVFGAVAYQHYGALPTGCTCSCNSHTPILRER